VKPVFHKLFSEFRLGQHALRNRMFVSAHMTMMVKDGVPSEQQAAYYRARAAGGVGLIVMESAAVHKSAVRGGNLIDATSDACIAGYVRIVEQCAEFNVPVIGQLFHPGREITRLNDGSHALAYAPSVVSSERHKVIPRELSRNEIGEITRGYASAARRFQQAGLVGAEILANQGYLQASFLNPKTNLRNDDYGGSFDKRLRFLRETITGIRDSCDTTQLLGLRISIDEMAHDGLEVGLVSEICQALAANGELDYLSITAGSSTDAAGSLHIVPPMSIEPGYLGPATGELKASVNLPVLVTGRINQPQEAEKILQNNWADMCGMTRANICDPEIANKASQGDIDDIRACIGCNQACIGHEQLGYPVSCIQHPETGRELQFGRINKSASPQQVYIAGAGPAGLKAASVAAERGHRVTLFEAENHVGGQVLLAQQLPGRLEFGGLVSNLLRQAERHGVEIRCGETLDRNRIENDGIDHVILATGGKPYQSALEIDSETRIFQSWDVISGSTDLGSSVLIADSRCDWIGLGLAEKLARDGLRVTLAVTGTVPGETIQQYLRDQWNAVLHTLNVEIINYARLYGAEDNSAYLQQTVSGEAIVLEDIDSVVLAQGNSPHTHLEQELQGWRGNLYRAGDCAAPRSAEEAVLEGLLCANSIE